jgi:hypothetical protein
VVRRVHSWTLRGVVVSHSFPFRASRRLKFSHNSVLPCTAFPSTLVSMLELSPPLPILLLPRVGGLSALSTRAIGLHSRTLASVTRAVEIVTYRAASLLSYFLCIDKADLPLPCGSSEIIAVPPGIDRVPPSQCLLCLGLNQNVGLFLQFVSLHHSHAFQWQSSFHNCRIVQGLDKNKMWGLSWKTAAWPIFLLHCKSLIKSGSEPPAVKIVAVGILLHRNRTRQNRNNWALEVLHYRNCYSNHQGQARTLMSTLHGSWIVAQSMVDFIVGKRSVGCFSVLGIPLMHTESVCGVSAVHNEGSIDQICSGQFILLIRRAWTCAYIYYILYTFTKLINSEDQISV